MDNVINAARSLGKIIQNDERYLAYMVAQQQNDEDPELQQKIGVFQRLKAELGVKMKDGDPDQDEISALNLQMRDAYADIFANENMNHYTQAREDMAGLLGFVNQIITGSASGEDPETIEYQADCGGSCASCAGCS